VRELKIVYSERKHLKKNKKGTSSGIIIRPDKNVQLTEELAVEFRENSGTELKILLGRKEECRLQVISRVT
jgi:hypothetical protein